MSTTSEKSILSKLKSFISKFIDSLGTESVDMNQWNTTPVSSTQHSIKSIQLKPLPPKGRSHQNRIVLTYEGEKSSNTIILSNEYFYLVYLLCLERLDDPESRWLSKGNDIAKIHIKSLEKSIGNKITIDYSWTRSREQLSTVVSKINKVIDNLIVLEEKHYTLIPELRDASSIILQ